MVLEVCAECPGVSRSVCVGGKRLVHTAEKLAIPMFGNTDVVYVKKYRGHSGLHIWETMASVLERCGGSIAASWSR